MSLPVVGVPVVPEPSTEPAAASDPSNPLARPSVARDAALRALDALAYPPGLAEQIVVSSEVMPYRFWIVDNSGSMQTADGKRLVRDATGQLRSVAATRWDELSQVVLQTAEVAAAIGARLDLHLLNRYGPHPQFMTLTAPDTDADAVPLSRMCTVNEVRQCMHSITPSGRTPLTAAVAQIEARLQPVAARLAAAGQKAVVVLCTDGLPDDPTTFLQAVQRLQSLPVWLVVRLCTDDDRVVEYWNALDAKLEAPLEVLDDEAGEAKEVHAAGNRWLTYAPQLHLARQFGMHSKLFDLLDETTLLPSQIAAFCEELLGCSPLPEPDVDATAFTQALRGELDKLPQVYDPIHRRMRPWIDLAKIRRAGSRTAVCALL